MDDIKDTAFQELRKVFAEIPFNRMLGLEVLSHSAKNISLGFEMRPDLIGNFIQGILHGGVISSVLDMAGGLAAMVSLMHKYPKENLEEITQLVSKTRTIDLNIAYIRPGSGKQFLAAASILHHGRRICFTQMELFNEKKTLIASGLGTYRLG